jgi:hypothetical protein
MSCGRESLLTKVTRVPTGTVRLLGEIPADVIVNVVPPGEGDGDGDGDGDGLGLGLGLGDAGELDPHAAVSNAKAIATTQRRSVGPISRTFWRY